MSPRPASPGLWLLAVPRPRTASPCLLSRGHVLRRVGELVASLVPALAAAPWLGRLPADGRAVTARAWSSRTAGALVPARG
jgi:hypothetical protein